MFTPTDISTKSYCKIPIHTHSYLVQSSCQLYLHTLFCRLLLVWIKWNTCWFDHDAVQRSKHKDECLGYMNFTSDWRKWNENQFQNTNENKNVHHPITKNITQYYKPFLHQQQRLFWAYIHSSYLINSKINLISNQTRILITSGMCNCGSYQNMDLILGGKIKIQTQWMQIITLFTIFIKLFQQFTPWFTNIPSFIVLCWSYCISSGT